MRFQKKRFSTVKKTCPQDTSPLIQGLLIIFRELAKQGPRRIKLKNVTSGRGRRGRSGVFGGRDF